MVVNLILIYEFGNELEKSVASAGATVSANRF